MALFKFSGTIQNIKYYSNSEYEQENPTREVDEAPQRRRRFHSTIQYSLSMRLTLNMSTHEHPKFKATIWSTYGGSMVDGALGGLW